MFKITGYNARKILGWQDFTLSKYFPKGTNYYYGYPSGEESGFLNHVPPIIEELVSARPLVCAGNDINIITFASTVRPEVTNVVYKDMGSTVVDSRNIRMLSPHINAGVKGKDRNEQIKQNLKQLVRPGSLVMAQPFLDEDLLPLYQIPPRLTNWLNDKQNMDSYIPRGFLPKRYVTFKNGSEFYESAREFPARCVIKVSSSSAGDGVYICTSKKMQKKVKKLLQNTQGAIFVEQYIEAAANYGIQFGIPYESDQPIDIIGVNQQLTTEDGEFIGGIIELSKAYDELKGVKEVLLAQVLPQIRELGWYGVGCFDVLIDKDSNAHIIDCNFRMTAMTAYLMLVANSQINKSLVSFSGEYRGTLKEFEHLLNGVQKRNVHILALSETDDVCRCNAAILFNKREEIGPIARQLINAGIVSKALDFFC
ncbi:MAG TPA: hypothetical protein VM124_01575 [Candidatus Limnocylindrales bacterium]|nr:hypothetical protein [Candidatus Limnocylindrales bacterium]